MRNWQVHTETAGDIGSVQEDNEELARCAALSKFGVDEEDWDAADERERNEMRNHRILPDDEFSVRLS